MQDEAIVYPPLNVPKKVADDIWIVDSGPNRPLGMRLPIRMTVIRLAEGGLLLHSPTEFHAGLKGTGGDRAHLAPCRSQQRALDLREVLAGAGS
jgi:hypothetical protein